MIVDLDRLFALAEQSPLLDSVEAGLRNAGRMDAADALFKLQQDAGVQIDREMNGTDAAPGPQTAALHAAFSPVTAQRLNAVLGTAHAGLPEGTLKRTFFEKLDALVVPSSPPPLPPSSPGISPRR